MLIAETYESPRYEGNATGLAGAAYSVLESQICGRKIELKSFGGFLVDC